MGDGVSLPIPPQFGCDECILTHITLYLNQKGGKSRAKLVGSSWYLTPLLWDTPDRPGNPHLVWQIDATRLNFALTRGVLSRTFHPS